jgi:hypothetical protein
MNPYRTHPSRRDDAPALLTIRSPREWGQTLIAAMIVSSASVAAILACEPPKSAFEAAAEGTYATELILCTKQYAHAVDIDTCAERVRARWVADGGSHD